MRPVESFPLRIFQADKQKSDFGNPAVTEGTTRSSSSRRQAGFLVCFYVNDCFVSLGTKPYIMTLLKVLRTTIKTFIESRDVYFVTSLPPFPATDTSQNNKSPLTRQILQQDIPLNYAPSTFKQITL